MSPNIKQRGHEHDGVDNKFTVYNAHLLQVAVQPHLVSGPALRAVVWAEGPKLTTHSAQPLHVRFMLIFILA